jgi:pentose-5-phosphate-3-epimerase
MTHFQRYKPSIFAISNQDQWTIHLRIIDGIYITNFFVSYVIIECFCSICLYLDLLVILWNKHSFIEYIPIFKKKLIYVICLLDTERKACNFPCFLC